VHENDDYLVRVKSFTKAGSRFTWELCRGDGLLVLQRSPKVFSTRIEALFDAAQYSAVLVFGAMHHLPPI
jgi:hypothetical protein